ncbi:MAG TPA: hypothetical protein VG167_10290 [Verrucomicrobiae bacterium]|nr:hypothetical protein [Verrucomicrobiae bacterium]
MVSFREYRRRAWLPLSLSVLTLYYFLVLLPIDRRCARLDKPLQNAWRALVGPTNSATVDFRQITNQLADTRQAVASLETAKSKVTAHLELPDALRNRLAAPFQLVDYQNERSQQIDQLDALAKQQKITVDPAVFTSFPEHTADIEDPSLLWASLAFTDNLLDLAVRCKVEAIHSLDAPVVLTNSTSSDAFPRWTALPIQVEFTASATNALRLLQALPLSADELRATGLADPVPGKVPLFIDRLIIRKESADKLDYVRVWVRALGFVSRDS